MDEEKKLVMVGLTTRMDGCSSSTPPPPLLAAATTTDSNINKSEGGDHTAEFRQKKGKRAKTLTWISSNRDMNNGNGDAKGSDGDCDNTVLSSLTTGPSLGSLISRKRVRTLGKVDEDSNAVGPPVPRKLRSARNKRASRTLSSSSPRHVKKRRHLSAISAQNFLMDRVTRFKNSSSSNSFTEEEEVLADTLLSLSQVTAPSEQTVDKATAADISNTNVSSTSCSEGAVKEDDKITAVPSAANEVVTQTAHTHRDQQVGQSGSIPDVNPALGTSQESINPHLPKDVQTHDLSLTLDMNLLSPSKDYSNNSTRKQLKLQQYDDSLTNPAKTEAPQWLVNHSKPDFVEHERKKGWNDNAQDTMPLVPAPSPSTLHGYSTKPSSSTFLGHVNTGTETTKVNATGSNGKICLVKNDDPTKTWKKSITHVYVCNLIQTHLNKEKASPTRVKPEERSNVHTSRTANSSTLNKSVAHFDLKPSVQPSSGICDTAAGQQKMVGSSYLNLPISAAGSGAQHVQYLHPQISHHVVVQHPYQQLPCSRGNLASAMALQQHMQQYIHNPGYTAHPGPPGPSPAIMKLQQFAPTPQQQQQMWQFHLSQYQQPSPDASSSAPMIPWQNSQLQQGMSSSLRPMPPPSSAIMPPQMELLCAPYPGGSGSRRAPLQQQQQLRLI